MQPNANPLRLIRQGTAGGGKTFVIKAITHIACRIFKQNGAVMNLAPTGAASVLLPRGRTVHSTTPIPRYSKTTKDAQLSDHPLKDYSLKSLKQLIGINDIKMRQFRRA